MEFRDDDPYFDSFDDYGYYCVDCGCKIYNEESNGICPVCGAGLREMDADELAEARESYNERPDEED